MDVGYLVLEGQDDGTVKVLQADPVARLSNRWLHAASEGHWDAGRFRGDGLLEVGTGDHPKVLYRVGDTLEPERDVTGELIPGYAVSRGDLVEWVDDQPDPVPS